MVRSAPRCILKTVFGLTSIAHLPMDASSSSKHSGTRSVSSTPLMFAALIALVVTDERYDFWSAGISSADTKSETPRTCSGRSMSK